MRVLQFISGFGPRKAAQLVKIIKSQGGKLENRIHFVTKYSMTPQIFNNCSGFIQIDPEDLRDTSDEQLEVLDQTRIHPIDYVMARCLVSNALDLEEEDHNNQQSIEQVLQEPEKLDELDLVDFASELKNNPNYGDKLLTVRDMKLEFSAPFKDNRKPRQEPSAEKMFKMVTREDSTTLWPGKMVTGTVIRFVRKRPTDKEMEDAEAPQRGEADGLWACKYCGMKFEELPDLWSHMPEKIEKRKPFLKNNLLYF